MGNLGCQACAPLDEVAVVVEVGDVVAQEHLDVLQRQEPLWVKFQGLH